MRSYVVLSNNTFSVPFHFDTPALACCAIENDRKVETLGYTTVNQLSSYNVRSHWRWVLMSEMER